MEEFKVMIRKHPSLFISDYCEISRVTVVEHQINLKPNQKPVAQKLQRLGRIQQEALLTEVKRLTQAGFIYPGKIPSGCLQWWLLQRKGGIQGNAKEAPFFLSLITVKF